MVGILVAQTVNYGVIRDVIVGKIGLVASDSECRTRIQYESVGWNVREIGCRTVIDSREHETMARSTGCHNSSGVVLVLVG